MNHSIKTRVLSMILAVVMVIGLVPMSVFATETEGEGTTPETVVVKFDVNGGVGEYEDQEVAIGNVVAKPEEDPTREAYTFAYWTANLEENEEWNFEENVVAEEMTLYASWTAAGNPGTEVDPPEHIHTGGTATCKDQAICECGEAYGELADHTPSEDGTVCALCDVSLIEEVSGNYTVIFNANGGTGTMESQVLSSGKLNKNTFTRNTFKFVGWNTEAKGTGTAYADESEITLTGDITLYAQWKDVYYSTVSEKSWDIAPGIKETELVLNNDAGNYRQVLHIMEADMTNPYVKVTTSYTNMDTSNYAVSNMLVQANWVRDNWGWNVVGAMNSCLSWYNSAAYAENPSRVNEPLGFMMVDAEIFFDPGNCGYTYGNVGFPSVLVINKDFDENGNPRPADIPKVEMPQIRSATDLDGWEEQVIPTSSGYIVQNGINVAGSPNHAGGAPRSVVGIKPDGTVVIMMNDGRQTPYSEGMNLYELAEVMISLGCSWAVNCDGGGSSTFLSQRPGTTGLAVNCRPSDGALRENTSGVLIISTAAADGEFDSAYISSDYDYYTPNSEITLNADGRDFSGAAAEIPVEAVWTLSDDSFGTVSNGVFVSNGKTGEVAVQIEYEGKVVGSKTLNIVNPDKLGFVQAETVIPYGKTIPLDIKATYGVFEVGFTENSFEWVISNEAAGVRDGLTYTATNDETVDGVVISATYKYADLGTTTLTITFGKGSETVWDFEDGDISKWMGQEQVRQWLAENNIPESSLFPGGNYSEDNSTRTFLSSRTNGGQVKNGNYALGLEVDYRYSRFSEWSYTVLFNVEGQTVLRDVANGINATKLGMWVYIPEGLVVGKDLKGLAMQYQLYGGTSAETVSAFSGHLLTANGKNLAGMTDADIPEDRWVYFYIDLSAHNYVSLQNPQKQTWREPSFIRFYTQHYTPKNMVFYFDDLTLDYSSAVDDRDAPVISDLKIDVEGNNKRTFNATIADFAASNTSGLDYSSAKIYVDGVALEGVTASGNRISGDAVELSCGTHTVTFEISDNLGNTAKKSQTFTIAGTAPVTLGGHNDLNNAPEYDSVYYVDINVAEIEKIEEITAVLDLNTAHLWEIEGMITAEGFTAVASVNQYANTVTVTVTKTGDCTLTGAQTLVSIPSRIYSWRDTSIYTAEEIFATGLCPVVPYDSKVVSGSVTFAAGAYDGFVGTFGGNISVVTNLDDNKNPWHDHEVAPIDDLAATCTIPGYTGRTYCEGCGSVINWGTKVPATGHGYDFVDGILQCVCGELFTGVHTDGKIYVDGVVVSDGWVNDSYYRDGVMLTGVQKVPAPDSADEFYYDFGEDGICKNQVKYTGMFQEGELYRYAYLGVLTSGWQMIDNEWYYFSSSTMAAVSGNVKVNGVYFDFEENGKLVSGVWASTFKGTRYYYGPGYYEKEWQYIDGNWYYFELGYRLVGYHRVKTRGDVQNWKWYYFDENGVSQERANGLCEAADGNLYYFIDGAPQVGLQKVEGAYYFFLYSGEAIRGQEYYAWETHCDLSVGNYLIGEDGKFVNGIIETDGSYYYYVNGKAGGEHGLLNIDGSYYFVLEDGKLITDAYYYAYETNCDLPVGNYFFADDGKLANGIVETEKGYYFCENGRVNRAKCGLILFEGDYYFAKDDGQLITNQVYYAYKTNCDLPVGNYEFGADGKMLQGIVEKDGIYYYYVNGKAGREYGLVNVDGDYYFALMDGTVITDQVYYAWRTNCDLPVGNYEFDVDGKMTSGIIVRDGGYYYYVNGKAGREFGLLKIGEYYYFVLMDGTVITDQVYYAWETKCDLPLGNYEFGADGKMLNGIVEKADGYYYYINGRPGRSGGAYGLLDINGDYYFVLMDGSIITDQVYYAWETYCDLPVGNYEFGADGKMLQGIVEKNGDYYYYVNGKAGRKYGLVKVDGSYYFALMDGSIITDEVYYAWETNCDLPVGQYEFGANGKALDGFVTKTDGVLYYYENGKPSMVGLNYIDGYYYFVDYGGVVITNQSYYVWKGNGLLVEQTYKFDENGRMIG